MQRFVMKRVWAELLYQDHLNSHPGDEDRAQALWARAYSGLELSLNSFKPTGLSARPPESTLDPRTYSRGWDGAGRSGEKPWL